ncbi:2OG-Fe(II) oxygenase [Novilysobacter spongiicola]|uniref:Prolyl 4-hydroxylase n=1 Tax=Lysobacter spongiicola DSM 21749 TaxID=1122188 RepID=A0A1T4MVP9_9GAMM|nr:2OG-Fe(II) oxygenase [Lysobacter spongiicola]SJZ70981.1 prolyl 4-hydroxylase [Lysobacter spongiicola DSM 21749]
MTRALEPRTEQWIVQQAREGQPPDVLLQPLLEAGWTQEDATAAVEASVRRWMESHARDAGLPPSVPVPSPIELNGASVLRAHDRDITVLANMRLPRVIVFGGFLSGGECDELVALSRPKLKRSTVLDPASGGDEVHVDRTSAGTHFARGANALCARIEARIAALLDWPIDHGESMQILRYGPGAEYRPHHDYFDPAWPGSVKQIARGGQRVASLVMYLNTPEQGGATTFPEVGFEVAAVKGNAVFFSYDRPHPMTRTLHAGAPVLAGEKWIATKWLREGRHD